MNLLTEGLQKAIAGGMLVMIQPSQAKNTIRFHQDGIHLIQAIIVAN
jgi:hypothetical protein